MSDDSLLDIRTQRYRQAVVLALIGEFDLTGRPRFHEEIARQAVLRPRLLILDLHELTFIDARGFDALATARTQAAAWSGRLLLAEATPRLRRLLRIVRLADAMPVYDSVQEAIAAQFEPEPQPQPPPVGTSPLRVS
jgi:anti-sigma B factor antagonist